MHNSGSKRALQLLSYAVIAVMFTGGCGQSDKVTFDSGGVTHTFAEGENSIPKDFLLPIYPGATPDGAVAAEQKTQEESTFLMLSTPDPVDKVSQFYQDVLGQKGWTIDKVETDPVINIAAHLKDTEAAVLITRDESGKKTTISLSTAKAGDTSKEDTESNNENYKPDKLNPPTD